MDAVAFLSSVTDLFSNLIAQIITLILLIVALLVSGDNSENAPEFTGGYDSLTPLQREIARTYVKYKQKHQPTFDEFCYPKSFTVQKQQLFAGDYMAPGTHNKELLVFHKIGAGKTCLSIQVAERWKRKGKPIFVMPASLIPGFRNELRSPCAGSMYLTEDESDEMHDSSPGSIEWHEIIKRSDDRIDAAYHIFSYNKFVSDGYKIDAPLIIIDEVQNVNNPAGSFYRAIIDWIESHPKAAIVLMSGTPIFDNPAEITSLARLLRIDAPEITPTNIPKLFAGKISYYAGAPDYTFPEAKVAIAKCYMSNFQARWYVSTVEAEMKKSGDIRLHEIKNDFYVKSRQRSNIVYPNGLGGDDGLDSLTPKIIRTSLQTYSAKFARLITKLKRGKLAFVYTGFTEYGGIAAIVKCLKAFGWKDFSEDGAGTRRFAVWSGDTTHRNKDIIRAVFNSPANDNSGQIQIIIGSPSMKEGVSLMRVRQVHVLELYWNHSRLSQVYGRVLRYCAHKILAPEHRNVKILIYAAITKKFKGVPGPLNSIDLYMLAIADRKRQENEPYIDAMIGCAVDRGLHGKD
jgi:hypothetical protein